MNYHDLIIDFAERTRHNLNVLRDIQKNMSDKYTVFEVTQLINSMLGLLVFPQQTYINKIPQIPLNELKNQGWPIPKVEGDYPQVKDLRELIRYLRNAIAHCNLEFLSDERGEIKGLKVWNKSTGKTTWKAELTIENIEKFTDKFIQLLLEEIK